MEVQHGALGGGGNSIQNMPGLALPVLARFT